MTRQTFVLLSFKAYYHILCFSINNRKSLQLFIVLHSFPFFFFYLFIFIIPEVPPLTEVQRDLLGYLKMNWPQNLCYHGRFVLYILGCWWLKSGYTGVNDSIRWVWIISGPCFFFFHVYYKTGFIRFLYDLNAMSHLFTVDNLSIERDKS